MSMMSLCNRNCAQKVLDPSLHFKIKRRVGGITLLWSWRTGGSEKPRPIKQRQTASLRGIIIHKRTTDCPHVLKRQVNNNGDPSAGCQGSLAKQRAHVAEAGGFSGPADVLSQPLNNRGGGSMLGSRSPKDGGSRSP